MKEGDGKNFINRMRGDYEYRTVVSSVFAFAVSVLFTGYNVFLGAVYGAAWNIGIAIYYALLALIRAYIGGNEIKFARAGLREEEREQKRKTIFLIQSILLLVLDIALITPIALMVLQQKDVEYSQIPAIAFAAYTVYKISLSVVNLVKTRKRFHIGVKILKNVNFIDALVSLLTLQYTLIMTFDGGIEGEMYTLCAVTSFAVWAVIVVVSVLSLISAVKLYKREK